MRRLLAHRNARLYLAGQGLSTLGDSAMWLAAAVWVKSVTGSTSAAGLVFFAFTVPQLAAPLAGLLVDRVRRRPLMVATNLLTGVVVLLLLLVRGSGDVWLIYAVMVLYGASNAVLSSGQTALLPAMLPDEVLPDANAALQTIAQGLRLVSPLLGAGLFAWRGGGIVAVLDAATFAAAAAALLAVRVNEPAPAPAPASADGRWLAEIGAGLRHVRETPILFQMVVSAVLAMLLFGFSETTVFAVVDRGLHRPPTFVGVLLTAQGVGAIAGGLVAAPLLRRLGGGVLFGAGLAAAALGGALLTVSSLPVVAAAVVVFGVSLPWLLVSVITVMQRATPSHLQGRVSSALTMVVVVPQTLFIALGAVLVALVDYRLLLVTCAAVMAVAAGYMLTRPERVAELRAGQPVRESPPEQPGIDPG
ncbi:MAG TPA: MFS transporter [Terriglobales bacterium]|nr:MFS transporter [Terriglobales bacterium]